MNNNFVNRAINSIKKRDNLLLNLIFFFIWIFAFRKLWLVGMLGFGDFMPAPENIRQVYETFFFSWQPFSRGIFYPQSMITFWQGVILLPFFKWPNIAQHIFNFLPFLLSFIFINAFLLKIVPNKIARFLASFFYAVNPATIGTFIGGAAGMLYVYAFFPATVYYFLQLYESIKLCHDRSKIIFNFLIFVLVFTFGYSFGIYIVFLFLPVALFFLIKLLFLKEWKYFFVLGLLYVFGMFFCLLLTFPLSFYTLPFFTFSSSSGSGGLDVPTLIGELQGSYTNNPLIDIALGGTYLNSGLTYLYKGYILGYPIAILIFLSILLVKNRKQKIAVLIFAIAAIAIISFVFLTHWGLTLILFLKAPGFLIFRSPAKLILLLAFPYSVLIAISINGLLAYISKKSFYYLLAVISLFILIFGYSWPFFVGDMTLPEAKKDLSAFQIPKHYYQISKFLNQKHDEQGFFRTVWLPFNYEGTEIKIHWLDENAFFLPNGWSQHGQSDVKNYTDSIGKVVVDCNNNLGKFLAPAAVKYFILNIKHIKKQPMISGQYFEAPISQIQNCLNSQKDLEAISSMQDYIIYQNNSFRPLLSAYQKKPPTSISINQQLPPLASDVEINIVEQNPSKFIFEVQNKEPVYLVLSQPYNDLWQAKINGQQLEHSTSFYQNSFLLNEIGKNKIEFYYTGQDFKNKLNFLFIISWVAWITLLIISIFINLFKTKKWTKNN